MGAFMLATLTVFAPVALAQCVQCKPSGNCLVCGPSTTGGCTCVIAGCDTCIIDSPCVRGKGCIEDSSPTVNGSTSKIKIDDATILEIGKANPRFAVALALLNRAGGIKDWAKFYSYPAKVESSEVIHWLKLNLPQTPADTKAFFRTYKRRVASKKSLTIEFTVNNVDDSHAVIRANITGPYSEDPPTTQLEIEVVNGKAADWRVS